MCFLCHHEALTSVQIEETPTLLIAGSLAVVICVARNGKSKNTKSSSKGGRIQRNGRYDRSREKKMAKIIAGIFGGYLFLVFLAPIAMPTDSVPELSGRANALDYMTENGATGWGNQNWSDEGKLGHNQSAHGGSFVWSELNPIWAFTYGFGDLNCHQKHHRSWEINGNQLAFCVRDVGIFAGAAIGAAIFGRFGLNRWTLRDTFLSVIPDEWLVGVYTRNQRGVASLGIAAIFILPMAIDGFTQLLTNYESNNMLRLVTGLGFGLLLGIVFVASLCARPKDFENSGEVVLPGGARFQMMEEE